MNVLLIRSDEMNFYSRDGDCRTLQRSELPDDTPSTIEALRPDGVVFLGVLNPSPIDSLCQLRTRGGYETLKAAIIRSEDEIRYSQGVAATTIKQALWRFRSLFQNDECLSGHTGRKFLIDLRARELAASRRSFTFSPMEFRLLVFFLRYPGVVFSRQELLQRTAHNEPSVDPQIIDVMVRRIRMKIELDFHSPHLLRTARGLGYKLADNGDIFFDKITGRQFVTWPCWSDIV
jgi:DNA-binding winged helix-turn-helix (wHTH) protein